MWFGISLLCFVAALYCWRLANQWEARKHTGSVTPDTQTKEQLPAATSHSTVFASTAPLVLLSQPQPAARATNWLAYRFKNTSKSAGQLLRDDRAILLENATIDTSQPLGFSIPELLARASRQLSFRHAGRYDRFRVASKRRRREDHLYIPTTYRCGFPRAARAVISHPNNTAVPPYEPPPN
jgi:hypothetical protein